MTKQTDTQTGLRFNPRNHSYTLDGATVPGVTTILGVIDKPALAKWAATSVAEHVADNPEGINHLWAMGRGPMVAALKGIPWQNRDEAAKRGTDVHGFAETIINGGEADVPAHLVGHVQSYLEFIHDYDIHPVEVEVAVGSRKHRYAGTLDLVADSNRHPRAIYDLKTARSGIYGQTAWQNVAYAHSDFYGLNGDEKPTGALNIEASFGVHIRGDGYDVHQLAYSPEIFEEFLHIRAVYEANKRATGNWQVPGSGYVGISEQVVF